MRAEILFKFKVSVGVVVAVAVAKGLLIYAGILP